MPRGRRQTTAVKGEREAAQTEEQVIISRVLENSSESCRRQRSFLPVAQTDDDVPLQQSKFHPPAGCSLETWACGRRWGAPHVGGLLHSTSGSPLSGRGATESCARERDSRRWRPALHGPPPCPRGFGVRIIGQRDEAGPNAASAADTRVLHSRSGRCLVRKARRGA